jgi:hypothetical protein
MSYIGTAPTIGNFQVCDAISTVNGQASYTMLVGGVNATPQSANHMLVSLNGILQKPNSSFTVSGSTITFASNLVTGDVIDFIQILGNVLDLGVPSDSTVSLAKLTATGTKDSTTFLRGDNTFASVTSPDYVLLSSTDASSSSIVSLDLFSSTYKNYKLLLSNITCTNNDWLRIRFRRSGADVTDSWYYNANLQVYRTSSASGDYNNSEWQVNKINFLVLSGLSNYPASSEITIFDPLGTSYTMMNSYSTYWENNSSYRTSIQGAILYDATTSVTGLSIYPNGGTITGNIKLYGIK